MSKHWFKYLVYLSLIFLLIALQRADYLKVPEIYNSFYLVISFTFLFFGFILLCIRWLAIIRISKLKIKFTDTVSSVGLSIFAKYIPGKMLVAIGKAGYINKKYNFPNDKLITYSLTDQILAIWTGLLPGLFFFGFIRNSFFISATIILLWFLLSFFIFSKKPFLWTEKLLNKLFKKKNFNLPKVEVKKLIRIIPVHIVYWITISSGFFFLTASLLTTDINYSVGYIFPIAVSLGIISVIAPGGVGIRETIIVGYLSFMGIGIDVAISISIASRLWFLMGEFFIFIFGFITDRLNIGKKVLPK